jgi:hypothetical protein
MHTTVGDEFIRYAGQTSVHSHLPNPAESEVRNLRERMRTRAENELYPLQAIAEDEVRKALLTGEALAVLPAVHNIGRLPVSLRHEMNLIFFSSLCFHQVIIWHTIVVKRHLNYHHHRPFPFPNRIHVIFVIRNVCSCMTVMILHVRLINHQTSDQLDEC